MKSIIELEMLLIFKMSTTLIENVNYVKIIT